MPLHDVLDRIRSSPVPRNEEAAKFQILAPVLHELGWDPQRHQDVLYEHAVGGKGAGRVDIALRGPEHVVALIEAKAPGQDLGKHVHQVIGYAFHQGADICVLTNGLEWWLYLPMEKGPPEKRRFAILRMREDRVEQLADDLHTFLGRENLVNGNARVKAKQVLRARHQAAYLERKLPEIWSSILAGPDEELVELVTRRAYEELNLRPDRRQVAAVLRNRPVPPVVPPDPVAPRPAPKPKTQGRKGSASRRPTGIRLWGQRYEANNWKEVLVAVAGALYLRHDANFDRVLEPRGRKIPWASRNPDDLPRARAEVGSSGIYIHAHGSSSALTKRAIGMLELFHHKPSDLEILFD